MNKHSPIGMKMARMKSITLIFVSLEHVQPDGDDQKRPYARHFGNRWIAEHGG